MFDACLIFAGFTAIVTGLYKFVGWLIWKALGNAAE